MKRVKNLVVGCGLTGMVLAERLASELKEEVLIIRQAFPHRRQYLRL